MGYNTGPIYAKVLVEHASIPLLGLANMIHPHAGTIGKAFVRLVNATYGGLYVEGHARVQDGAFYFEGGRIASALVNVNVDAGFYLHGARIGVQRSALTGGLFPSSRLITISQGGSSLTLSTPRGHGDKLGQALLSWA